MSAAAPGDYLPFLPCPAAGAASARARLPAGACDTHFHVFEDSGRYPFGPVRSYTPTPAPMAAYRRMADHLGIDRAVLVHPSVYGDDHRTFEDALAAHGRWLRGVAVARADTPDATIARWHALGARGTRLNLLFKGGAALAELPAIADRVRGVGWHLQLLIDVHDTPGALRAAVDTGLPVVVDHFGHLDPRAASASRGFADLLALLREGRAWVKLSGAYRLGGAARAPHDDVQRLKQQLLAANPRQLVWGSDWPHPAIAAPMVDDERLLDAILDGLSDDERQAVFVDNPARLYWADGLPGA